MRVSIMCHPVATVVVVTLLACAAAFPASDEKRQTEAPPAPVTKRSVRYCQFQTPCAWRIYTSSDYAEISLANNYCVCKTSDKCMLYERHLSEGYSEFRCVKG